MNNKANLANLEELRKAIEESIFIALVKLGDKAKNILALGHGRPVEGITLL